MAKQCAFSSSIEERNSPSFLKFFQDPDFSSQNMRAIPADFVKRVPEEELLSIKMLLRVPWGMGWEIDISRNSGFYYMEKRGWGEFTTGNSLRQGELVTFTYDAEMCFNVHIYQVNGTEMVKPRNSSSGGIKTEQEKKMKKDVKEKQRHKKKVDYVPRDSAPRDSVPRNSVSRDSVPQFVLRIQDSYLNYLLIPKEFWRYMPKETTKFLVHSPDGRKLGDLTYLVMKKGAVFSRGWPRLARDHNLAVGDVCTCKFIKLTDLQLLLIISSKLQGRRQCCFYVSK